MATTSFAAVPLMRALRVALATAGLAACAHSAAPVSVEAQRTPAAANAVATYQVCFNTDGSVKSVETLRSQPGKDAQNIERLRAIVLKPQPAPVCREFHMVPEESFALPQGPSSKPTNVPPHYFELQLVEKPMPRLPDAVKARATGSLTGMYKICASTDGQISTVITAAVDPRRRTTTSRRRCAPGGSQPQPIPICSMLKFEFAAGPRPKK